MLQSGRSFSGRERNCVFLNTGGARFANVSSVTGLDFKDDARGIAVTDWDFDGDLDLWISNRTAPRVRLMRNNNPGGNHFIALKLTGVRCNRDAVGARVELHLDEPGNKRRIKSVRCGNGFLSQSSSWLHFGLAAHNTVHRVKIHWPGGDVQTLSGLPVDQFYQVTQDKDAKAWSPGIADSRLQPGALDAPKPTGKTRVIFAAPVPLPALKYHDMSGAAHALSPKAPTLINLWASWCIPCAAELKELNQAADSLKEQGIHILALSVDGLDKSQDTTVADAKALAKRLSLSLPIGMAGKLLVDKVNLLYAAMREQRTALPVPTSLLVDQQQRVIAMYLGPVSPARVLEDFRLLRAAGVDRRRVASGFEGQFYTRIPPVLPIRLPERFAEAGFLDDAAAYLDLIRRKPQAAGPSLLIAQMNLGNALVQQGKIEQGIAWLRRAVAMDENNPAALTNLGLALLITKQNDQGFAMLKRATLADPSNAHIQMVMGDALYDSGDVVGAAAFYDKALQRDPRSIQLAYKLAMVLAFHDDADLPKIDAVNLAEQLATVSQQNDPLILDILAAAYAKAKRFDDAAAAADRAVRLARKANQQRVADEIAARRDLYRLGKRAAPKVNTP